MAYSEEDLPDRGQSLSTPHHGPARSPLVTVLSRLGWLGESATAVPDPAQPPPVRSHEVEDNHLITLAAAQLALLVSGDKHLLRLAAQIPVFTQGQFLDLLHT